MADPTKYTVSYDFSGFQATNPDDPLPGMRVDNELANIATSLGETIDALVQIRRDDGALQNGIVTPESLDPELQGTFLAYDNAYDVAVANGFVGTEEEWLQSLAANFTVGTVTTLPSGQDATVTATGTAPNLVLDFGIPRGAQGLAGTGTGDMLATDYDPTGKVASAFDCDNHDSGTVNKVFTAAEQTKLAALDASVLAPPGMMAPFAGSAAPTGWLLCYGQAVSRVTYAALFAAIGTTHGAGDGSTTFNLPDMRGRVIAGLDNMGGVSANRLTGQSGGVNGDILGQTGGAETHALTGGQNGPHSHGSGSLATASAGAHSHLIDLMNNENSPFQAAAGGNSDSGANDATSSAGAHIHDIVGSTASSGSGQAHNNVQPTIIMNYIIKT